MAGSHELVCGAVSGGMMATGVILGRDKPTGSSDQANTLVDRLILSFRDEFGTVICYELIGQMVGVGPRDERWREMFKAHDVKQKRCANFVRFIATRWLDLLQEMK